MTDKASREVLVRVEEMKKHFPITRGLVFKRRIGSVRAVDGVVSVHNPDDKPHLAVVEYNPQKVKAVALLDVVKSAGVHAELIGL